MSGTIWQAFIKDEAGNILPGATITVRDTGGNIVPIWSNRATTSTKSNPFVADDDGYAFFYRTAGVYNITAVSGDFSATFANVPFGEGQEYDIGTSGSTLVLASSLSAVALNGAYGSLSGTPTLGTMADKDTGTAGAQYRTNTQNDARYFKISSNLSEGTASAMRSNLGLGTAALADTADVYQPLSTGTVTGGALSVNSGDNTKFDIAATTFDVIDHSASPPAVTSVTVAAQTAVTVTDLSTEFSTDVAYDVSGTLLQQRSFTDAELRSVAFLGGLDHSNKTNISRAFSVQVPTQAAGLSVRDLAKAIGDINKTGNVFSAASTDLTIAKSAGTAFSFGRNAVNSVDNPHTITQAVQSPATFTYVRGDGAGGGIFTGGQTSIDPSNYDGGAGSLVSVGGTKWSIQRLLVFSNSGAVFIQYGATTHNKKEDAKAAIVPGAFTDFPGIASAMIRGYLIVQNGATNLSSSAQAEFLEADKFGAVAGSSAGDVAGPNSATDGTFALFDGTSGKIIKEGGTPGTAATANLTTANTQTGSTQAARADHVAMLGNSVAFAGKIGGGGASTYALDIKQAGAPTASSSFEFGRLAGASTVANDLTLLGPNTSQVRINFGDPESATSGEIGYNHATDTMRINASGTEVISVTLGNVAITGAITATTGVTVATGQDAISTHKKATAYTPTPYGSAGSAGTFAADVIVGQYTDNDGRVDFEITIGEITDKGSWTGDFRIPLAHTADLISSSNCSGGHVTLYQIHGFSGDLGVVIFDGVAYLIIIQNNTGVGATTLQWSDISTSSGNYIRIVGSYTK